MEIMDCTLRDGANVVGAGFSKELTTLMIKGLIAAKVDTIEMGHCTGLGTMKAGGKVAPVTDEEYLEVIQPFVQQAHIGMFQLAKNADPELISLAQAKGLSFLRIGANAGDGKGSEKAIKLVRQAGLDAKYSLMKAYVLTPEELAEEAKLLEDAGVQEITIMDSAGYMFPADAARYTDALVHAVSIPVGFHGHNNMGLAIANALAAENAGAEFIDCGLMGMARSAGNIATEGAIAAFQRQGKAKQYPLYTLLHFIDDELMPAMLKEGYHNPVKPLDLVLGYSGCHSSFLPIFRKVAEENKVDLYQLIVEVSNRNKKNPDQKLMEEVAKQLQG